MWSGLNRRSGIFLSKWQKKGACCLDDWHPRFSPANRNTSQRQIMASVFGVKEISISNDTVMCNLILFALTDGKGAQEQLAEVASACQHFPVFFSLGLALTKQVRNLECFQSFASLKVFQFLHFSDHPLPGTKEKHPRFDAKWGHRLIMFFSWAPVCPCIQGFHPNNQQQGFTDHNRVFAQPIFSHGQVCQSFFPSIVIRAELNHPGGAKKVNAFVAFTKGGEKIGGLEIFGRKFVRNLAF